jgi:replicative DNA helicase
MSLLDRVPPQNLEAERGVIGSIILNGELLDEVSAIITVQDFYSADNAILFSHLQLLQATGKPVDVNLMLDNLTASGDLERIGGEGYLAEVASSVPFAHNAVYYAGIVRELADRRQIIQAAEQALVNAHERDTTNVETLAALDKAIQNIGSVQETIVDTPTAMERTIEEIREGMEKPTRMVKTGFRGLDRNYGGLGSQETFVLAARPGQGKSSLAMQVSEHVASLYGPVLFIPLEMSTSELTQRRLCRVTGIDAQKVRTGAIEEQDVTSFEEAAEYMGTSKLFVWPNASATVLEIARAARTVQRMYGLSLLVVDHIGLVTPADRREPRHEQVGRISRELKQLARDMDIPVMPVCQLNREADGARPQLKNLRDSGAIEQDADVVCFLYREGDGEKTEMIISKHRHGQIRDFYLTFDSATTTFSDIKPQDDGDFAGYDEPNRYL